MKYKKQWILIISILMLGGCFGDRMIASVAFKYYCEKLPGLYVYEKVELGDEYFLPMPEEGSFEARRQSYSWTYDKKNRFDKQKVELEYIYEYKKSKVIFSFGSIIKFTSSIKRVTDNKILSESISLSNQGGWLTRQIEKGFSGGYSYCPDGRDQNNRSLFNKEHKNLIKETFYRS